MNNFTPLCPHLELNSSLTGHTRASNFRTSHCTLNKLHKENVKTPVFEGALAETEMMILSALLTAARSKDRGRGIKPAI